MGTDDGFFFLGDKDNDKERFSKVMDSYSPEVIAAVIARARANGVIK